MSAAWPGATSLQERQLVKPDYENIWAKQLQRKMSKHPVHIHLKTKQNKDLNGPWHLIMKLHLQINSQHNVNIKIVDDTHTPRSNTHTPLPNAKSRKVNILYCEFSPRENICTYVYE